MALNGDVLAQKIVNDIVPSSATTDSKADALDFWKKVCNDICKHIKDNLDVTIPIS